MIKVKRAIISVSDKAGLIPFAKGLDALGVEILSTGGTAKHLRSAGIPVKEVSDYTQFPEMLDGRVKTLHPKIHGGLLALRNNPGHMEQIKKHNIGLIDLVAINLYPFESVISKKNVTLEEAIENIDIGGPSMLRSAAKNFKSVAVVSNPSRYPEILKELENNNGLLSDSVLFKLAIEAFGHTAKYDSIIFGFLDRQLNKEEFAALPKELVLKFSKLQDLRYGENPHQQAAFYKNCEETYGLNRLKQRHGKELSFNNILDLDAAINIVKDFSGPAAVIIKHNNPTGVAEDKDLARAYRVAWEADKLSAFGGIIGLNRPVDLKVAKLIEQSGFMECVIAPRFEDKAFELLAAKKNLRLVELDLTQIKDDKFDLKEVLGGLLLQDKDARTLSAKDLKTVTKKKPAKGQIDAMLFAWTVVKHVRSNAVVLAQGTKTVGIGAGQTSRVGSFKTAVEKAGKQAKGAVMASEAFLPHIDNIQLAKKAGIAAIIQTGGSLADAEVIKAANKAGIAMVFTGVRHFKH